MNKLVSKLIAKTVSRNTVKFDKYVARLEVASNILKVVSHAVSEHLGAMRELQPHYAEMNHRFYEAALTGNIPQFLNWVDDVATLVEHRDPVGARIFHRLVNDLRERHAIAHDIPFTKTPRPEDREIDVEFEAPFVNTVN